MKPCAILFFVAGVILFLVGAAAVFQGTMGGLVFVVMGIICWYLTCYLIGPEPETKSMQSAEPALSQDPVVYPNDDTFTGTLRDAFTPTNPADPTFYP